jgi:hypothetical protein
MSGFPLEGRTCLATGEDFRVVGNMEAIPLALRKNCILFYAPETEELAKKIAQESDGTIRLGEIRWRCVVDTLAEFAKL